MYYNGKTIALNENSFLPISELRKVISVIKLMYCIMKIAKQKISLNFVKIRIDEFDCLLSININTNKKYRRKCIYTIHYMRLN